MKLSVVLCTYNGARFLQEQLESIETQTLKPDELVVCDDKSTDDTLNIIRQFSNSCSLPVSLCVNEKNIGSTRNFEKAIQLSMGDIIVLCDQDDVWKPLKLEKIMAAFTAHPEIGYVFTDAELVDENLVPLRCSLWESFGFVGPLFEMFQKGEQVRCFLRKQQFVTGATMAFRASLKELVLPVPSGTIWIHDGWFAIMATALGVQGLPLPEKLILYRQHSAQQAGVHLPTRKSLAERYALFKHGKLEKAEEWQRFAESYHRLEKRLEEAPNRTSQRCDTIKLIGLARKHLTNRAEIQTACIISKIYLVLREATSGRYRLFGNPLKSFITDLFV